MQFSTSIALLVAVLPAVLSLPAALAPRQFKLPTCGMETCLTNTTGLFDGCAPNDLACLCTLQQSEITRYIATVEPCLDGAVGHAACTDGAIYQYKDLLKTVCATEQFGNKTAVFPEVTQTNSTTSTNTTASFRAI